LLLHCDKREEAVLKQHIETAKIDLPRDFQKLLDDAAAVCFKEGFGDWRKISALSGGVICALKCARGKQLDAVVVHSTSRCPFLQDSTLVEI
jgi:hypothetical protein